MGRLHAFIGTAILLVVFAGTLPAETFVTAPSGLKYRDLKIGSGMDARLESTVTIHLVGWLQENGQLGRELYNSRKEKRPISFVVGTDKVMKGWNAGVVGMRAGGTRVLIIPPELGFGKKAIEDTIPPNARMLFIIQLLEVE